MEDQPVDSSDLNTVTAPVPQGKAARNRHRLPRPKPPTAQAESGTETGDESTAVTAKLDDPAENGSTETASPDVPKRKGRMPWRRKEAASEASPTATSEGGPSDAGPADAELVDEGDEPEEILVPHRPAGRALKVVALAAASMFVAAAAFAGATVQPYLVDRAAVQTKFLVAKTAANAITTLWTYTPDDMDQLPARSAKFLGGDFATDYKRYIDAIVQSNKQAQVSNNTEVLGAAVETLAPAEATALVYTNSVATSPLTKGIPSLRYLSYRLTMKREDDRWLITQMVAVTKLDLTPRL